MVICPQCSMKFRVPLAEIGLPGKCPSCTTEFEMRDEQGHVPKCGDSGEQQSEQTLVDFVRMHREFLVGFGAGILVCVVFGWISSAVFAPRHTSPRGVSGSQSLQTFENRPPINSGEYVATKTHDYESQHASASIPLPTTASTSRTAEQIAMDTLVTKISQQSGISEESIRKMSPDQQREMAGRWIADYIGTSSSNVKSMSASDKFEAAMQATANRYGISVPEAKRFYEVVEKFDRRQSLTSDEQAFLIRIQQKIGR